MPFEVWSKRFVSSTSHIIMVTAALLSSPSATKILFHLFQAVEHVAVDGPPFADGPVSIRGHPRNCHG